MRDLAGTQGGVRCNGARPPNYYVQDGAVRGRCLVLNRIRHTRAPLRSRIGNVFHAGDGSLHPLICYDERVPGEADRAVDVGAEILSLHRAGGRSRDGIGADKSNTCRQCSRRTISR